MLVPAPCPYSGVLLLVCYSCLARALLVPTRARATLLLLLLVATRSFSPATRPLLVAALRSYSSATRARHVPVPVGARACAVPLPLRTRSLPFYPPP